MQQYKIDFINFMIENGALKFGEFTLKSGRKSPFFMNAGNFVSGSALAKLGKFYAEAVHDNFGDNFDVMFGPAYKGIPLAVAACMAYSELYGKDVRYCANRKEEKDHGSDKGVLLGSELKDGERVVIIEDVTTSGKSIEETMPILQAQGSSPNTIKIVGEMVLLDRMERGLDSEKSALAAISEKYGFPASAIVTMEDVIDVLYTNGDKKIITDEIKLALDEYYKEYGAVTKKANLFSKLKGAASGIASKILPKK